MITSFENLFSEPSLFRVPSIITSFSGEPIFF